MTIVTPVPSPTVEPTPTYTMATKTPPVICGKWATVGDPCTMAEAADPTPTPLSRCPTVEKQDCLWTGRDADASPVVAPSPTYVSYPGSG